MRRCLRFYRKLSSECRSNSWAGVIAVATCGFLALEFQPVPAGADIQRMAVRKTGDVKLNLAGAVKASSVPAAATADAADASGPATAALSPAEANLRFKMELLNKGIALLNATPAYSAQFTKQELIGSEMSEEQSIELKVRHEPFSVYLKWMTGDRGREVLYVDGENDGRILVHAGGWKARLPALNLEPESSLALSEARYPVTRAGILEMAKLMVQVHERDMAGKCLASCERIDSQPFADRDCYAFVIEYETKEKSPQYRKSITFIDKETNFPVYTKNFAWPDAHVTATGDELDEQTLLEFYTFSDIVLNPQFASADFQRDNEEYRFR